MAELVIGDADTDQARELGDRLVAFNAARAGDENYRHILLALNDAEGRLRGGAVAYTSWNVLVLDILWVDDDLRGQGHGDRLLAEVEQRGLEMGCTKAVLDTFSFQAETFYAKRGYRTFARLDAFPPGHHRAHMTKPLTFIESGP